jgi:hypothetical protein
VKRHFIENKDFSEYLAVKGVSARLKWLHKHAETRALPPNVLKEVQEGYSRRLEQIEGSQPAKVKQTSFGSPSPRRPRRHTERRDYTWKGQRDKHEGQVQLVQAETDGSSDPISDPIFKPVGKRPATPYSTPYVGPRPETKYPSDWEGYDSGEDEESVSAPPLPWTGPYLLEDDPEPIADPLFLGYLSAHSI